MKYYVHFISFSFQYYRYHFETVRLGYPYSCNASYILFISSFFMICEFALVCFLLILLWQCALLCDEFRPYFALPTLFIVTIIFLGRFPLSGLTLLRWSHFSIWLKIGSCHAVQLFSGNSRAVVDFKHESQQRGKGVVIFASPSPSPPPHTHTAFHHPTDRTVYSRQSSCAFNNNNKLYLYSVYIIDCSRCFTKNVVEL